MLKSSDKQKIETYIQKNIDGLLKDIKQSIALGMSDSQVIERVTEATVNKFTPESKMIMCSIYNMMKDETLSEEIFQNSENKTVFYQMDILKELNSKFSFKVPDKIDYSESKNELDKWIKCGSVAVVVIGGTVSIKFKNLVPFGISVAVALVAIMGLIIYNKCQNNKINVYSIASEYLNSVKISLMIWIESIERYYDEKIEEIKKGIDA